VTGALLAVAVCQGPPGAAAPSQPQEPATTVSPLTVTRDIPPLTRREMARALDGFIRARQTLTRVDRVARWRAPICVETLGLPQGMDAAISARITQVGAAIGAPRSDPPGCQANVEVVFTAQPQQFIDLVAKREWILLGYHFASQTERITRFVHPVQAWYVTGTRSYSNGAAAVAGTIAESTVGTGQIAIDDPLNRAPGGPAGTRLPAGLSSEFANVLIVVDQAKVAGQSTEAIADYVAVLTFAPVANLDSCNPLPSILDLLAKCEPSRDPQSITASDLSYLKSLYAVNTRLDITLVRDDIANLMTHTLRGR
jgi:hypothetical protein